MGQPEDGDCLFSSGSLERLARLLTVPVRSCYRDHCRQRRQEQHIKILQDLIRDWTDC
jgi:hypothetical protein